MINNKIKALLSYKDKNFTLYADKLGITKQSLNNKANREAYKIKDLIKLAELTGTELSFIDKETGKSIISFDMKDIKEWSRNKKAWYFTTFLLCLSIK